MQIEKLHKAVDLIMGKSYELSLVKGYVSRWGLPQAVRELIQNALDSESPFVYEWEREEQGINAWRLKLRSEFTTLSPRTLLLGATSKANNETSIGSFGEGYKLALLVLTRLGYQVEMLNGDLIWRPVFRMSRSFGEEILCIDESFAADRLNRGLTVIIHGLEESDKHAIIASCLRMQEDVGAIKRTQYGDILLDQKGKLYVGSLYICETELHFGYNIKPANIQLERDRETVSSYDLKSITLKCWYDTGETERVAQMIKMQVPDVEYSQYDAPELIKEECYRIFKQENPGALIARSPEEMKAMVAKGLVKTVYTGGGGYYEAVSSSRSYRAEAPKVTAKMTPQVMLAAFLHSHRDEMRTKAIVAFKQLMKESESWISK